MIPTVSLNRYFTLLSCCFLQYILVLWWRRNDSIENCFWCVLTTSYSASNSGPCVCKIKEKVRVWLLTFRRIFPHDGTPGTSIDCQIPKLELPTARHVVQREKIISTTDCLLPCENLHCKLIWFICFIVVYGQGFWLSYTQVKAFSLIKGFQQYDSLWEL